MGFSSSSSSGNSGHVNNVPAGRSDLNGPERKVYVASRFVGGSTPAKIASWISWLTPGPSIPFPSPLHHWAIQVGDWYHQLGEKDGHNYYDNGKFDKVGGSWNTFEIGSTKFNDNAIVSAAIQAINAMPEGYDVITNNCQNFALNLADKILRNGRMKLLTASGLKALPSTFVPGDEVEQREEEEREIEVAYVLDGKKHIEQLEVIQKLMLDNTPTVTAKDLEEGKV